MAEHSTVPPSLANLPAHSIFVPPSSSSSSPYSNDDSWELVRDPDDLVYGKRTKKMAFRGNDLLLAVGKEVRMAEMQGHGEVWPVKDGTVGTYQTLKSAHLGFQMNSLVVSEDGRLLAVVGRSQVVIMVLPQLDGSGDENGSVDCKAFTIDPIEFSATSDYIITQVTWHPWGAGGNSLWILTSDGKLREYDISTPDDPSQTFSLFPSSPTSRFTAVDPLARYVTSFTFFPSIEGFGATMIHLLTATGDVYLLGPILPLRAEVPSEWLRNLSAYAAGEDSTTRRWVGKLQQHAKEGQSGLMSASNSELENGVSRTNNGVRLFPPHLTPSGGPAPGKHSPICRQGPVTFSPAPKVTYGPLGEEDVASDMVIILTEAGEAVMGIAWAGGRVDVGMLIDMPTPKWVDGRNEEPTPPTMAILDSITLPLPTDDEDAIRANFPIFVRDPLQPDVLYIQHSFGVDGLSIKPILESLRSEGDLAPGQVTRLVQSGVSPINSISGFQVVSNLTLGYALIALSSANQVAAVELDYRVASRVQPTQESLNVKLEESSKSLLSQQPLEYDAVISSLHIDTAGIKSKSRGISGGAPMDTLSTTQLRSIAEMITSLQQRTRAIRKASQEVERRLDICVKEYERQLTLLKDSTKKIDGLRDDKTVVRAQVLLDKQADLAERLDKVLGTLRAEHRPDLSEVERKWFAELDGMKRKVEGGLGSTGLRDRTAQLSKEFQSIRPSVEASMKQAGGGSPSKTTLAKQLRPLENGLDHRASELKELEKKMGILSVSVDEVLEARK